MYEVPPPRSQSDPPPRIQCVHTTKFLPLQLVCGSCLLSWQQQQARAHELWAATNAANRPPLVSPEGRDGPASGWRGPKGKNPPV